jgi:hypothetical protein
MITVYVPNQLFVQSLQVISEADTPDYHVPVGQIRGIIHLLNDVGTDEAKVLAAELNDLIYQAELDEQDDRESQEF